MNLGWIRDQHLIIDYQCFNFRPFESNLDCLSNYSKTERIRLPQLPFQRFPPTQIIAYIERNSAKWTDWKGIVSIYDEACPSASKQDLRMPLENRQSLRLDQDFEYLDAVHDNQALGDATLIVIEKHDAAQKRSDWQEMSLYRKAPVTKELVNPS